MHNIIYKGHKPVFIREIIEGIITGDEKDIYVDATFGTGGHSAGLLKELSPKATILAFDLDQQSIKNNTLYDSRLKIFNKNFRYIENVLRIHGIFKVSAILADLGVSSPQIDTPSRGFSIRFNQILDMRMDQRIKKSAKDILNRYSIKSLTKIFFHYSELKNAKKLAKKIVYKRKKKTIENTFELMEIVKNDIMGGNKQKFFAKIFQSLRIEVNDELNSLKFLLKSVFRILKKGGKIAVISYHRLEDRVIKQFFKNGCFKRRPIEDFFEKKKKTFLLFKRKPILTVEQERKKNTRARSARLRISKKK